MGKGSPVKLWGISTSQGPFVEHETITEEDAPAPTVPIKKNLNITLSSQRIFLSPQDLHSISDNREITAKVIDAYFLLCRQMNTKALRKCKTTDKVLYYSTRATDLIFQHKKMTYYKNNIF